MPETPEELYARAAPVRSIGEIGRVHVCRWGDGGEHLHWWFMGRPARIPQLSGRFAAVWDDVLPPLPEDLWRANVAAVVAALAAGANQPPAGGSASGEKLR